MAENTVYLHAGQGKTGTSYIQSAFALSIQTLAEHGIEYPIADQIQKIARNGMINSGNIRPDRDSLETMLVNDYKKSCPSLLISNESIFNNLFKSGFVDLIRTHLPDYQIKILIFIRDPLELAVSSYHQIIKRGGYTDSFDAFLQKYAQLERDVQIFQDLHESGIETSIWNYSRHKNDVLHISERFLGLDDDTLQAPAKSVVNRSMTRAELELQKAFNKHYEGRSSAFISDRLCNSLPDIPKEMPEVSKEALTDYLEKTRERVERISPYIPETERHFVPELDEALQQFSNDDAPDRYHFTAEQLDLLAMSISQFVKDKRPGPRQGQRPAPGQGPNRNPRRNP